MATAQRDTGEAIAANPLWYHTIELAPGVETPGWFDLRPIIDKLPWPDVAGKRCLDIGTYDGQLAFELERRGASEVVATDISDHESWDWPPATRARGVEYLNAVAGPVKGLGFRIAKDLLGSRVERLELSIYDLRPDTIGRFDVIVCGSLLLHLRDPLRALEAVRSVCAGYFLSAEEIRLGLTLRLPRRPVAQLDGDALCQWWVPNSAGHTRMVYASGFAIERETRPYAIRYGRAHPRPDRSPRALARRALMTAVTGADGIPNHALLARPRV